MRKIHGVVACLLFILSGAWAQTTTRVEPPSIVSGRVTDYKGHPVAGIDVQLVQSLYLGGLKEEFVGGYDTSDDLGNFRIIAVKPGRYYAEASPRNESQALLEALGVTPAPDYDSPELNVSTYYPNATSVREATLLEVTRGSEVRGIDIRLRSSPGYLVRGKVVLPNPEGTVTHGLELVPSKDTAPGEIRASLVNANDGTFTFRGVFPGTYELHPIRDRNSRGDSRKFDGRTSVVVKAADIDGVVLTLSPTSQITGRVLIEGGKLPKSKKPPELWVRLFNPPDELSGGEIHDDGTFRIEDVGIASFKVVLTLGVRAYIKSIEFSGRDISKIPLEIGPGTSGVLDIRLSPHPAELSVSVHRPSGEPVQDASVLVWSRSGLIHILERAGLNIGGGTGPDGKVRLTNIPPGEVYAVAWEQEDWQLFQNPAFLAAFENQATLVNLGENAHKSIDVKIISHEQMLAEATKMR